MCQAINVCGCDPLNRLLSEDELCLSCDDRLVRIGVGLDAILKRVVSVLQAHVRHSHPGVQRGRVDR